MARDGRTLTKHFQIETRQHDLFNIDLGEGIPRRMLVAGLVLVALWFAGMWALLGAPTSQSSTLYLLPPTLIVYFGFQEDPRQPRRRRITQWAIYTRYMVSGHRPIIRMGARSAYRSELVPVTQRTRRLIELLAHPMPQLRSVLERDATDEPHPGGAIQAGLPIVLTQTAVLYGFDYMQALRQEKP